MNLRSQFRRHPRNIESAIFGCISLTVATSLFLSLRFLLVTIPNGSSPLPSSPTPLEQHIAAAADRTWKTTTTTTTPLQSLEENVKDTKKRTQFLETKLNSYLSFRSDPFLGMRRHLSLCQNKSYLTEFCSFDCVQDQKVCLDDLPTANKDHKKQQRPCIVYDFGIREEPDFGRILSDDPFHCQVYAFDPSAKSKDWYEMSELQDNPNYHFYNYGAGGIDGNITLFEYNWNQVTMYRYPEIIVDPTDCDEDGACHYKTFKSQRDHLLPVRSLPSLMKEFGHERIDIVKLDVEGSEYRFLEAMIASGACRYVDQLVLEWHHFDYDTRYGTSSSPIINMFVALLDEWCGLKQWFVYDKSGGWPAHEKIYTEMGITLRYNLASFKRVKEGA